MRRTTPLTAATLLGLALLSPTAAASAAGETCRGEAATLVGTGPVLTGTEGPDVIVTGSAETVNALGGADLICIAGVRVVLDAGAGNDAVFSRVAGEANHDVVSLGAGDDAAFVASSEVASDAGLDGGDGSDRLALTTGDTAIGLDLTAQTLTTSLGSSRLASFESTSLATGTGKVTYRGTAGDDLLTLTPGAATPVDISTEAGQDGIVVEPATIAAGSRLDGGNGRNKLIAAAGTGQMTLDLRQDLLVVDGRSMTATGIQDAFLIATDVVMVGDQRGNNLSFAGCHADVRGEHGRDRLVNAYDGYFEKYTFDCATETRMSGAGGADYLRGGQGVDRLVGGTGTDEIFGRGGDDRIRGNAAGDTIDGGEGRDDIRGGGGPDHLDGTYAADTLIGGGGRDTADGSRGRDRCVAERESRCER